MTNLSDITRIAIVTLIALTCACASTYSECASFPSEYKKTRVAFYDLSKVSLELPAIKRAVATIQKCYPYHRYSGLDYKLEIQDARNFQGEFYLVIAELYGVNDLRLIFKINRNGKVINSYQASML